MVELLDILDAFSMPLKVGWVVWIAWGIGQTFWYRSERRPQAARAQAVAVRRTRLRPNASPLRPSRAGGAGRRSPRSRPLAARER